MNKNKEGLLVWLDEYSSANEFRAQWVKTSF